VQKFLAYGKSALFIVFGISMLVFWALKFAGVVDQPDDKDFFKRGNSLENVLRPSISTREDFKKFREEGGLGKHNTWKGYRATSVRAQYDDKSMRLNFFSVELQRESNGMFFKTATGANDLKKTLNPVCNPNGGEWRQTRWKGQDEIYTVESKKYSCMVAIGDRRILVNIGYGGEPIEGIISPSESNGQSAPLPAATSKKPEPVRGKPIATLAGKDYNYQFVKLEPEDAGKIFTLMARQPANTRPLGNVNENPIYQDAEIVNEANGSSRYAKTSLVIGNKKMITTSPEDENETQAYEMVGLSAMETQPEILVLHTYAGGNSCESQQQVLVFRGEKGFYSTEPFGRCSLAWWEDKDSNTAYFVYSADEYSPMEVLALSRINK